MKQLVWIFLVFIFSHHSQAQTDNILDFHFIWSFEYYVATSTVDINENASKSNQINGDVVFVNPLNKRYGSGYGLGISLFSIEQAEIYGHIGIDFMRYTADPIFTFIDEPDFCATCSAEMKVIRSRWYTSVKIPIISKESWKWSVEPAIGFDVLHDSALLLKGEEFAEPYHNYSFSISSTGIPMFIGLSTTIEKIVLKRISIFVKASCFQSFSGVQTGITTPFFNGYEIGSFGPHNLTYGSFNLHAGFTWKMLK